MFKKFIIIIFFIILSSHAAAPTVWKDGEFLLWSYGKRYLSPADFCFALRYENEKIGNPVCYEAGDWERDTTLSLYAKWLNTNLDPRLDPEDLRPRNAHVLERLGKLKDNHLIFSTIKNDMAWFLLFDENSSEPKQIAIFPLSQDSVRIVRKLASDWFGGKPQRRLTDAEREAKEKEPDEYFAEQPMHDLWFGIGLGHTQAKVPLTPNNWYSHKLNSKIKNYRDVDDSTSVWFFIKDTSPIYRAYIGGSLYDFIGLEFELRKSSHKAKIDESDTIYNELDHWDFNRYELMLALEFMKVFMPIPQIEIETYASASVLYDIFTEDIALKDGYKGSKSYKTRFEFESYYRGVALTLGLRTAFFKNYAIDLRTGLANRGTAMKTEEVIGSSTYDAFIAAGLEYHIRWK
ncbi:MAG: hypothetical protein LBC75_11085 [Fibromonadaceae bacterium]|jgi:hypothetical protein|nr:hypothetical protein [Fibromonadaceae bacterium]